MRRQVLQFTLLLTTLSAPIVHAQDDWLLGPLVVHGPRVSAELKLNNQQSRTWKQIHEEFVQLRKQRLTDMQRLRQTLGNVLESDDPNLSLLAQQAQQVRDRHNEAGLRLQNRWLKLYAEFKPEQKAVIRQALKARSERSPQSACP